MNNSMIYRALVPEEIRLSEYELRARLGGDVSAAGELVCEARRRLREIIRPAFCARLVKIACTGDGGVTLGQTTVRSEALVKNLAGAESAYLVALTLGAGVDRELLLASELSMSRRFVLDATASAMADAAMDMAEDILCEGYSHSPRFSPGYGDLPLDIQRDILLMLSADRLLGITLTKENLMIPTKSITAIIGIKDKKM